MRSWRGIIAVTVVVIGSSGVAATPTAAQVEAAPVGALTAVGPSRAATGPEGDGFDPEGWRQVSVGGAHTCAIVKRDGDIYCWGSNADGQLRDPTLTQDIGEPGVWTAALGLSRWVQVSAGSAHTCALSKQDGTSKRRIQCWGRDVEGQLGDGPGTGAGVAGRDWASVSAGGNHTCAVKTSGALYCWGSDWQAQLGDGGGNVDRDVPTRVGTASNWASVDAGFNHTCARTTTGRLYCWGDNEFGALGIGAFGPPRSTPVQVQGGRIDWASVSSGNLTTCARRTNGRVFCWGVDGVFVSISNPLGTPRNSPTAVDGSTSWTSVEAGSGSGCGRQTSGRLYCWGRGLGNGTSNQSLTPVQVSGNATDWKQVTSGVGGHHCALRAMPPGPAGARHLFCWGADNHGQVGDGGAASPDVLAPVAVSDPPDI